MSCNIGKIDKVIRLIVGLALIIFAVISGNIFGYIGILLIITAGFSFCPMYTFLGINTGCKLKEEE